MSLHFGLLRFIELTWQTTGRNVEQVMQGTTVQHVAQRVLGTTMDYGISRFCPSDRLSSIDSKAWRTRCNARCIRVFRPDTQTGDLRSCQIRRRKAVRLLPASVVWHHDRTQDRAAKSIMAVRNVRVAVCGLLGIDSGWSAVPCLFSNECHRTTHSRYVQIDFGNMTCQSFRPAFGSPGYFTLALSLEAHRYRESSSFVMSCRS